MNASGENPYQALLDELRSLHPSPASSFWITLYVNQGLFGLAFLFCILSLIAKVSKGKIWLFSLKSTAKGNAVCPNGIVCVSALLAVFVVCAETYMVLLREALVKGRHQMPMLIVHAFLWVPLWLACYVYAWAMASWAFVRDAQRTKSRFRFSASVSNTLFIVLPIAFALSTIGSFALATWHFAQALDALDDVKPYLLTHVLSWKIGPILEDPDFERALASVQQHEDAFFRQVSTADRVMTAWIGICCLLFHTSATIYIRALRKQLHANIPALSHRNMSGLRLESVVPYRVHVDYALLILGTVSFAFLSSSYFAIALWAGLDFRGLWTDTRRFEVWQSLAICVFTVFGLPAVAVMSLRALRGLEVRWRKPLRPSFLASRVSIPQLVPVLSSTLDETPSLVKEIGFEDSTGLDEDWQVVGVAV